MIKENKGFTLIELLVVVAIIGILSGIAFVSISGARLSAYDTQIRSELSQIRSNAEQWYYDAGGRYAGYEESPGWTSIYNRIPPCATALLPTGVDLNYQASVDDNGQAYAAWAPLCGDKGDEDATVYYCVDSTGSAQRWVGLEDQTASSCEEMFDAEYVAG